MLLGSYKMRGFILQIMKDKSIKYFGNSRKNANWPVIFDICVITRFKNCVITRFYTELTETI